MSLFSLFTNLPTELQDMIWEFAIKRHQPTAHLVKIKTTRWADGRLVDGKRTKTCFHRVPDTDPTTDHNGPAISALLLTTTASRAVVQRVFKGRNLELAVVRPPVASAPTPLLQINVADDLVLLEQSWYLHADRNRPLAMDRARYMAFPAPDNDRNKRRFRGDFEALADIYKPRVVYAVVDPETLAAAKGVAWPHNEVWEMAGWNGGVPLTLDGFLEAYDDKRGPRGPFLRGNREYYEISAEEIKDLGGLKWLIADMEAMRCTQETLATLDYGAEGQRYKYWTRHRLMSWREV